MIKGLLPLVPAIVALGAQAEILIDVRSAEEFARGHVEEAVLLPVGEVAQGIAALVPDKEEVVYLYCRSGNRSETARRMLLSMGYRQVYNLGSLQEAQAWLAQHPEVRTRLRTVP